MPSFAPSGLDSLRVKNGVLSLVHTAGTYDILTATGDVWVEISAAYVKTAGSGLTSALIQTNHTVPKSIVASTLAAAITLDLSMALVTTSFLLPDTKKIQGVIVGTGIGGEIDVIVKWAPLTAGATLS